MVKNYSTGDTNPNPFGEAIIQAIERISKRTVEQEGTRMRWATVTGLDPLAIRYDREDDPSSVTPIDLDGNLSVGDRVRVIWFKGQATILPRKRGGSQYPQAHAAVLWNGEGNLANASVTQISGFADNAVTGSALTIVGSTLEVQVSGWYTISGSIRFDGNSSGHRQVRILVSGPNTTGYDYEQLDPPGTGRMGLSVTTAATYAEEGSIISLRGYQNSGGTLAYTSFSDMGTSLRAALLGV